MQFRNHGISYHSNANYTQMYLPISSGRDDLLPLFDGLEDLKHWMGNSFLKGDDRRFLIR